MEFISEWTNVIFVLSTAHRNWQMSLAIDISKITIFSYLSGEPRGVATPKPFESRFRPTFIVSHGSRSLIYSIIGDSMSRAYLPFDVRTRRIPSSYEWTKTCFLEFMNSHILLYNDIWDFCWGKRENLKMNLNSLLLLTYGKDVCEK